MDKKTKTKELKIPHITQLSATRLPYPDNYFDAVVTDPPYYDNVPYSYLSDFFYVWLKRTLGHLYPELFATPLTPKSEEIIDTLELLRGIITESIKSPTSLGSVPIFRSEKWERIPKRNVA